MSEIRSNTFFKHCSFWIRKPATRRCGADSCGLVKKPAEAFLLQVNMLLPTKYLSNCCLDQTH